ncbi:MAG: OmpA family protein [Deltaproteobacteria bacterium]|nr:OmpA family protein [Deltaproteobacteria bacterium]
MAICKFGLITVLLALCSCASTKLSAPVPADTEQPAVETTEGSLPSGLEQANAELALVDQRVSAQRALQAESEEIMQDLKRRGAEVRLTKRGVVVNLPDVLFGFDSADLSADALRAIREIAVVAKAYSSRRLAVEGHTDAIGTILYNKKLSDERARRVAEQLAKESIPTSRITVYGFGETRPISSNRTEAGRKRNRRVEVIFENV